MKKDRLIRKSEPAVLYKNNVDTVHIEDIVVSREGLRTEADVDDLVESIKNVGLLNPLTVNSRYELISGGRRYSALRKLNWQNVPVLIVKEREEHGPLIEELTHLDENLVRLSLDSLETEQALSRRKKIYEQLHPETKRGGDRKSKSIKGQKSTNDSFVKDTAKKLNKSPSTVKEAIRRAELSSDALSEAREQGEIGTSQATEIARLPMEDQNKIVPYLKGKDVATTKSIVNQIAKTDVYSVINSLDKNLIADRLVLEIQKKTNSLVSVLNNTAASAAKFSDGDIKILTEIQVLIKSSFESLFRSLEIQITVDVWGASSRSAILKEGLGSEDDRMVGIDDDKH